MEDSIPETLGGQIVSLADKLDTLRGCFSIGLIPSGSKDPFALRRAAQGVVKILVEARLELPLRPLVGSIEGLYDFFVERIKYYFKDVRGFRYDEVNAALAAPWDTLSDLEARLDALQQVRPTANFEPLAASFKRIQNILRQGGVTSGLQPDPALLEPGPESELYAAYRRVSPEVARLRAARDYRGALAEFASLRPHVDLFFDKILVNAPDEAVRRNRFHLLYSMFSEFSALADFSEIVTS
jgi:glycyl-tRNA synthetase beta chain